MRSTWADLPEQVRDVLEERLGPVAGFASVQTGNHAELAGVLTLRGGGRVFLKGAGEQTAGGLEARLLRYEARVLPTVSHLAPELVACVTAAEWTVLALEYIDGRHPDYRPGSPDLDDLAEAIEELQGTPCPEAVTMRVRSRWDRLVDASPMDGHALLHADLNPANLLITGTGRRVLLDWSFASRGAAWVEPALLIPWLLQNGHVAAGAAAWLGRFPSWAGVDPAAVDLWSHAFAETWERRAAADPATDWKAGIAAAARDWADHRLGKGAARPI